MSWGNRTPGLAQNGSAGAVPGCLSWCVKRASRLRAIPRHVSTGLRHNCQQARPTSVCRSVSNPCQGTKKHALTRANSGGGGSRTRLPRFASSLLRGCLTWSGCVSTRSHRCLSGPLKAGELRQTRVTVSKPCQVRAHSKTRSGGPRLPPSHRASGPVFVGWLARRSTTRHASVEGLERDGDWFVLCIRSRATALSLAVA